MSLRDKVLFSITTSLLERKHAMQAVSRVTDPLRHVNRALADRCDDMDADAEDSCNVLCNPVPEQTASESGTLARIPAGSAGVLATDPFRSWTGAGTSACSASGDTNACRGQTFWKPVGGNMRRHTVEGEPMESFDYLAQVFRPCAALAGEVHVLPDRSPVAIRLEHLSYDELSGNLQVWKLCQSDGKGSGFVHSLRLRLSRILWVCC